MSKQIYIDSNGNEVLVSGTITNDNNLPHYTGTPTAGSTAEAIGGKIDGSKEGGTSLVQAGESTSFTLPYNNSIALIVATNSAGTYAYIVGTRQSGETFANNITGTSSYINVSVSGLTVTVAISSAATRVTCMIFR